MQRQLALSSLTVGGGAPVEGASELPELAASHYQATRPLSGQGLPMPDMCIVDTRPVSGGGGCDGVGDQASGANPADPLHHPDGGGSSNSPPRQMQTSFITFKPTQPVDNSGASIYNHPCSGSPARTQGAFNAPQPPRTETPISEGLLNGDSPKVTSKLLPDPKPQRDSRNKHQKGRGGMEDTYGSRVGTAGNIYEKRLAHASQLPCAECSKETIKANNVNAAQEKAAAAAASANKTT